MTFDSVRERTVEICAPLEPEDHVVQPWEFVSPPKWHLGHTTWFFETFCLKPFFKMDSFDPSFQFIFNSYYESQGEHISQGRRGTLSRPSLDRVIEYRRHIDARMREASQSLAILSPEEREGWQANVELGLHHEQQHQELLMMDIKAILWHQPGRPAYSHSQAFNENNISQDGWLDFKEGIFEIGNSDNGFAFDNESPRHKVFAQNFSISKNLVSNREYLQFIEDKGYNRAEFWLSDGWNWVKKNSIQHPLYWSATNGNWSEYTLGGAKNMNLDEPVSHVSYFESDAFARWKKCRLPTEAEWEIAFHQSPQSPLWQWTQSAYLPYPGFQSFARGFEEYNGKFMINQMVLRGGCSCTPEGHYRSTYRNFFYPEMRWQFSGIRLAK